MEDEALHPSTEEPAEEPKSPSPKRELEPGRTDMFDYVAAENARKNRRRENPEK